MATKNKARERQKLDERRESLACAADIDSENMIRRRQILMAEKVMGYKWDGVRRRHYPTKK